VAEFGGKGNVQKVTLALETALAKFNASLEGASPWFYPSIAEYSTLLDQHGLEVRQALLFDRPTRLEDGERGLAAWIAMFGEFFLHELPAGQRSSYIRAVEDAARPSLWSGDHWELDYRRLRIMAVKSAS